MLVDSDNAFGGYGTEMLRYLSDDYGSKSIAVFPCVPADVSGGIYTSQFLLLSFFSLDWFNSITKLLIFYRTSSKSGEIFKYCSGTSQSIFGSQHYNSAISRSRYLSTSKLLSGSRRSAISAGSCLPHVSHIGRNPGQPNPTLASE